MPISNVPQKANGYIAFTEDNKSDVIQKYVPAFNHVTKAVGSTSDPRTMRSGYDPGDYYSNRPQDAGPFKFRDVVYACRRMYLCINIVRNVVDLMTDFACEDLKIIHADKSVEAFF